MERRSFLQGSMLASFMALTNQNLLQLDDLAKPFIVKAGQDRNQQGLHIMGGEFDCKVASKDNNGAFLMYDTMRIEKGGPPLHIHRSQDECFYIVKGEFIVRIGDETDNLKAGDLAFVPRKTPHAFAKINEGESQMLVMFQPAGSMEDFFLQMSKLGKNITKDQNKMKELWASHEIDIVGPPLKF